MLLSQLLFHLCSVGFLISGSSLAIMVVITVSDDNNIIRGQVKFSLKDRGLANGFRHPEILFLKDSGKIMVIKFESDKYFYYFL